MQFLFSCSCTLAATDSALPTRVAIKKNSRRDAKQKEVIPLALSDLFQFYKIHQGTGLATLLALLSCKLRMHFFQLLFLLQQCESSLYFFYNKILQLGALVFDITRAESYNFEGQFWLYYSSLIQYFTFFMLFMMRMMQLGIYEYVSYKEKVSIKSACSLLGLSGDFALCAFLDYKASLLLNSKIFIVLGSFPSKNGALPLEGSTLFCKGFDHCPLTQALSLVWCQCYSMPRSKKSAFQAPFLQSSRRASP